MKNTADQSGLILSRSIPGPVEEILQSAALPSRTDPGLGFLGLCSLLLVLLAAGCTGIPEKVSPVTDFDVNRYLGTWYEIARFDHSFERGLEQVTAEYSLREDGSIRVLNQGFDKTGKRWKQAEGKAYFIGASDVGRLKVSFFGPFYGAYNIIDLDKQYYQYSMVCGPDTSYLWILARQPVLDQSIIDQLSEKASSLGFDTSRFIFVKHDVPTRSDSMK